MEEAGKRQVRGAHRLSAVSSWRMSLRVWKVPLWASSSGCMAAASRAAASAPLLISCSTSSSAIYTLPAIRDVTSHRTTRP